MPINMWANEDRPREKLLEKGKGHLSKAELVAILIGSGSSSESAVDLARKILDSVDNNLAELSRLSINDLCKFKGIGKAKAISIIAALEIGRRRRADETLVKKSKIQSSSDVYEIIYAELSDKSHEEFWILLLDRANQLIIKKSISDNLFTRTRKSKKLSI